MTSTVFVDKQTQIRASWLNAVNTSAYVFSVDATTDPYLADKTGVADSSAAIQAAIDYMYSLGGGEVHLPAGTYKLTAPLYPKFGVSLVGPNVYLGIGSVYNGAAAEGKISGVARLLPTAAITTAAVYYDFQMATQAQRPYGARLVNIVIDSRNQGGGDCLYICPTPAGQGPFSTGFAQDSLSFENCVFRAAPRYGACILSTATERMNAYFYDCQFALNGSHGIYAYYCYDIKVYNCLSFGNTGDGMYMDLCATERIYTSDFFNNSGNGLTLDGFDARYIGCAFENNYKHGVEVKCVNSTIVNKKYRFDACRFGTNGYGADNTYDNLSIGSYLGAGIARILLTTCSFGAQAQSGTANRVRSEIYLAAITGQIISTMSDCVVDDNDLKVGNDSCNAFWMQSASFDNVSGSDGQLLGSQPRSWTPWAGAANQNITLGSTFYETANVGAATLKGFAPAASPFHSWGREVWVWINDVNTTVDFTTGNLKGNGGQNLAAPCLGTILHFKCFDGTNWAATIYGSTSAPATLSVAGVANPVLKAINTVTSGAGASAGTLLNSPAVGNPTKWIPFNDAGVVRYIPAW